VKSKKFFIRVLSVLVALIFAVSLLGANVAHAATPADIEEAIVKGLAWLADQQQGDGSWLYIAGVPIPDLDLAATGLVVLKFEERANQLGLDPFNPAEYEYAQNVIDGLDYIFSFAIEDSNGVHFPFGAVWPNGRDVYDTGIAMMAIAASMSPGRVITTGPLAIASRTYQYALQRMMDALAFAQNITGGWGYSIPEPSGWSDQSNSGYATLGIVFANSPSFGFNVPIPPAVVPQLNIWIDTVQIPSGTYAGGAMYNPPAYNWVNILKTGNLLQQLSLVGDGVGSPRVQAAVGFIETYWGNLSAAHSEGAGWIGNYQSMFCLMKGLKAYGIDTLSIGDWFGQVSDYIIADAHKPDADHWYWESTAEQPAGLPVISTAWALLTLEKVTPSALTLIPPSAINLPGTDHTVTAIYQLGGVAQGGVRIDFEIISGPNAGLASGSETTDPNGEATFTYTDTNSTPGDNQDTIRATAFDGSANPLVSAEATKTWIDGNGPEPGPEVGGNVYPVSKINLLAPWIIFAMAIVTSAAIVVRRRQIQS